MTKVIKGEFENLGFLEINDDSFTCKTQLDTLCDEFNRLSRTDNDVRGDDEVELSDKESLDPTDENPIYKNEVAEIFRIETNIFDFKTSTCRAFKEFNYLLQSILMSLLNILMDLRIMKIIKMIGYMNGIKMCHGYMKNLGQTVEYGKNQSPLNIIVNHSRSNAKIQNGRLVIRKMMDIVMEETCLELI
nr:hypothetical protein [Tanacetum cinerariifolium]